jgi:hypothetical protein
VHAFPDESTARLRSEGAAPGGRLRNPEKWLDEKDALFLRKNRSDPIVVAALAHLGGMSSEIPALARNADAIPASAYLGPRCG